MAGVRVHIMGPAGTSELVLRLKQDHGRISEAMLCRHFQIPLGAILMLQISKDEADVSIEMPKIMFEGATYFLVDVSHGNSFLVENSSSLQESSDLIGPVPINQDILRYDADKNHAQTSQTIVLREASTTNMNMESTIIIDEGEDANWKGPVMSIQDVENSGVHSVVELIEVLPFKNKLRQLFSEVENKYEVDEIPQIYDGNCFFELPHVSHKSIMSGMEAKYDGHVWSEYVTSNISNFPGIVRKANCAGHLMCEAQECPYHLRTAQKNQRQWKGRLTKTPLVGPLTATNGSLICLHCSSRPICVSTCYCSIYYCLPQAGPKKYTRCVLHQGYHDHPVEQGANRKDISRIKEMVKTKAKMGASGGARYVQQQVTRDVIMGYLLSTSTDDGVPLTDSSLQPIFDQLIPLTNKRRMERWIEEARSSDRPSMDKLESVLELKRRSKYEYIHGVIFPGQLDSVDVDRCHVFKMSTTGPGSGVDIVNRMRPDGDLCNFWVCFDHVKRIEGWTTMAAHVYDPYMQELLTICVCDFKVEDTDAQVLFWKMLNQVMEKHGHPPAQFRGFMADEAQANWRAVRTVYNGGPSNVMEGRERSCLFHWEQSMVQHTRNCVKSEFHEAHKRLCRKWKNSPTRDSATMELEKLISWWSEGRVIEGELPKLQTWIMWWHARISHWGAFMVRGMDASYGVPRTNLSESIHGSWLASEGQKHQISLYAAAVSDMTTAVLQSARCHAFMSGDHHGKGPSLKELKERCTNNLGRKDLSVGHVMRVMNIHVEEMGIDIKSKSLQGDLKTIRRKRPASRATHVGNNDSHRPEYEYVTRAIKGKKLTKKVRTDTTRVPSPCELVVEKEVHDTAWAIRRTPVRSRAKCSGYSMDPLQRCTKMINSAVQAKGTGRGLPAPSFFSCRHTPIGVKGQMSWFCSDDVRHTWRPVQSLMNIPKEIPSVWVVAKGTDITLSEKLQLEDAGFILENQDRIGTSIGRSERNTELVVDIVPTKMMEDRIGRSMNMHAVVVHTQFKEREECIEFDLLTEGSTKKDEVYKVKMCEHPTCSCKDFQLRDKRGETYVACKHIYFVFFRVIGLTKTSHAFVHKSKLLPSEMRMVCQKLRGVAETIDIAD